MTELLKAFAYTATFLLIGLMVFKWCAERRLGHDLAARLGIAIVVSHAATFLSPRLWLFHAIAVVLVPLLAPRSRFIAPTYIFLLLTLPLINTPVAVGGLYIASYDIGVSLTIGALVATLIHPSPRVRRPLAWDVPFLILFVLMVAINARGTTGTNILRVFIDQILQLVLPYIVIRRSIASFEDLRYAIGGVVAAVAALSSLALYEAIHAWPIYRIAWAHYQIDLPSGASVKLRGGLLRSPGPFAEPTSFAFCLSLGVLAAMSCASLVRSRDRQLILIALLLAGICAPQSRNAWIGLICGVATVHVFQRQYAALGRKFVIAAMAILVAIAAAGASSRIGIALGLTAEGAGTVDYRTTLLTRGIQEFWRHPLLGAPVAQVLVDMKDLTQGEGIVDFVNTFLFIALTSGVIGFAAFVLALGIPIAMVWRRRRAILAASPQAAAMAAYVFGASISIALMLLFTSLGGRTSASLVIMLAFAAAIGRSLPRPRASLLVRPADDMTAPAILVASG